MQKFISTKQLYNNFKKISDEVQQGTTFVVLKYSQPVYRITPLKEEKSTNEKRDATSHKSLSDEFKDLQFSSAETDLSQNIDTILYS